MRRIALIAAGLLQAGCAATWERAAAEIDAQKAAHAAALDEVARTAPICESDVDCKVKWEAAQVFVANHSIYRMQTVTDVLISTMGPNSAGESGVAFQVTREPQGNGRYRIVATTGCYYPNVCGEAADTAAVEFNHAVNAAH